MKNIYKALANFQQSCPVILKDTQGFGYTYADLPDIYKVIMPLLKENGLGFTQILKDKGLETTLFHIESGETISGYVEIPSDVILAKMNQYQVMGSAYSYFRRYALSSMLGIVTDKDTDANTPTNKSEQLNTYEMKLNSCKTIVELQNSWLSIPTDKQTPELIKLKDNLKLKLS